MKRFDICPARGVGVRGTDRLVALLQNEHFTDLDTAIVAPLYLVKDLPGIRHLRPEFRIGKKTYVIAVDRMASMPKANLGEPVASASDLHFELLRAADRLFSGF